MLEFLPRRRRLLKQHQHSIVRAVLVVFFLVLAIVAISLDHWDLILGSTEPWLWLTDALISVGPELAGIGIGVVSIDIGNERRQRQEQRRRLIREMGSPHNEIAVAAVRELRDERWLTRAPGLKGVNLSRVTVHTYRKHRLNCRG